MIVNIVLNNDLKFNVLKKSNKTYNFLIIFNNFYFLKLLLDNDSNIFFLKNLNFLVIRFDFYKNNNVEVLLNNIPGVVDNGIFAFNKPKTVLVSK